MLRIAPARPELGQQRRRQPVRELAQLLDRERQLVAGARDQRRRLLRRRRAVGGEPEVHGERREPLLGAVVQVAHDLRRSVSDASTRRARDARRPSPNSSRSATTAARQNVVSAATAMNSWVLTTLSVIDENTNGADVVRRVPDREAGDDGDRERRAVLAEAQRRPDQRAGRRGRAAARGCGWRARAERDQRDQQRAALERRPATMRRGGGRDHAIASGTRTSAPVKSPSHHVRQTMASSSASMTPPASCASEPTVALDGDAGGERGEHAHQAADAAQRRPLAAPGGAAAAPRQDLEQVPAGLEQRGADRGRAVVVGQQVADQDARPQPRGRPGTERDADAGGQPHDRRHRAGDLEREDQLRGAVVGRGQREHGERIAKPLASEGAWRA